MEADIEGELAKELIESKIAEPVTVRKEKAYENTSAKNKKETRKETRKK
jgi:hypothetical protein